MTQKKRNQQKQAAWAEAARRCRLSADEIQMSKELGIGPASLIKNIPSRGQQWKQPVRDWVRELYEKKFGKRKVAQRDALPAKPAAAQTSESTSGSVTDEVFVPF